jgi:hypothetical protein
MQRDKDQSAPRGRPALTQRLSKLLHLRRLSWASSASAHEKGNASSVTSAPQLAAGPTTATPLTTAGAETATSADERIAKPIVETDMPAGPLPKEPTLPIALPDDPRVEHRFALLNGIRYHYLYAEPSGGKWKATLFLVGRSAGGLWVSFTTDGIFAKQINATHVMTMSHCRFTDGPTSPPDGASRSRCS